MQTSWQVGLLLVALAVAGGCDVGRAAKGGGQGGGGEPLPENIDGTYIKVAENYKGDLRLPDDMAKMSAERRKVVFANGTMTTSNGIPGGEPKVEKLEIDRTKSPAQVTFTLEAGDQTITNYGVMAMIGGQLTVCRQVGGFSDPEHRITQISNGENYITWKLKKENAAE
jgi:hypothetical protein